MLGVMSIEQIAPKSSVEGADEAIRYYGEALDAVLRDCHVVAGRVLFAELELPCGAMFQVKDADEFDPDPVRLGGRGVLLAVVTAEPDELTRRMVTAGGETVFEVADREPR